MLKEAVYRSPKWMRNFIDFEVNTGKDIKGEPSKRAILKEWDKRWKECNNSSAKTREFIEFYSLEIEGARWSRYISSSELDEIRLKHRGDMAIWEKFDKWLPKYRKDKKESEERYRRERERERYENEQKQQKIKKDLDDLYSAIVKDFSNNPYFDKYSTQIRNGNVCFDYKFENGDTFNICGYKITYKKSTYTVGTTSKDRFVKLCNNISQHGRKRPGGSKSWSSGSGSGSSDSGSRYSSKTKSDDPNRARYDKLVDNIKLREEQLKKMSKTDKERTALENELDNYKRAAERMKTKHKFENIKSFIGFFKY
jgi:hypothetical protein